MKTDIRQHDLSDCAAACIASVARHYGRDIPLSVIREASGTSQAGTSIKGILDACRSAGFRAAAYKSEEKQLEQLYGLPDPLILHTVNGRGDLHFVVLYALSARRARIMDPERGKTVRISAEQLRTQWTGYLVTMTPDTEAENRPADPPRPRSLFSCLRLLSLRELILMLAGSVVYIVAGLCSALFLQYIIDRVIPAGDGRALAAASLLMLAILVCTLLVGHGRILYALRLSLTLDGRLTLDYLHRLFRLPTAFFSRRGTGELHARIGDASKVRGFLVDGLSTLLTGSLIFLISFTLMFTTHWRLSLLMLAFIPIYLVLYLIADSVNSRVNRDIIEQSAVFEETAVEGITAVRTVRYFGQGEQMLRNIEKEYRLLVRKIFRGGRWTGGFASASDGLSKLLTLTLLTAGALFIFAGSLTIGTLVSFYSLTAWFTEPLGELVGLNDRWTEAKIAWERLCDIAVLPAEESGIDGFEPQDDADIVFDRIEFSYPGCPQLLHDFSLTLKRGRITAVQGPSGCGKSSLAALLMRDFSVQGGAIRLGIHDIRLFSLDAWRNFVSIVPQEPYLFNGTILENVAGLDPEPDIDKAVRLLEELGLGTMVRELPMGLFSRIGERGGLLSGGQRQRIAMARALYREPKVLILDEATASLDEDSQQCLLQRMLRFRDEGGTVMMITHKADNAALADQIATL